MEHAIETVGLTKSYKGFKAVDGLGIHVRKGKIYGFLGKNGAGKTTTIRMIMGLIRPDTGNILVFGKDIKKDRKWISRNIGAIVETPGFYENLSARDNLDITAELYGADKKRLNEVLDIVQLVNVGKKRVKDFSLGMKQRLGIANALVHSPRILILDEPANGLDPAGIKDMRRLLRSLSEDQGITVLISSHILSEIQQLADVIGIIDQGKLLEETDIEAIKSEGQNCMLLEVDNTDQAASVLREMQLAYKFEQDAIKVFCSKDINSRVNRNLVMKGINVFNLYSVSQSLEERFLPITGERSIQTVGRDC